MSILSKIFEITLYISSSVVVQYCWVFLVMVYTSYNEDKNLYYDDCCGVWIQFSIYRNGIGVGGYLNRIHNICAWDMLPILYLISHLVYIGAASYLYYLLCYHPYSQWVACLEQSHPHCIFLRGRRIIIYLTPVESCFVLLDVYSFLTPSIIFVSLNLLGVRWNLSLIWSLIL